MGQNNKKLGNRLSKAKRVNASGTVQGVVQPNDRLDFYRFTLNSRSSFTTTLDRLKANADLALLDSTGRVLIQSRRSASKSESINSPLAPGSYYLRIIRRQGETTYRLRWTSTSEPIAPGQPDLAGRNFVVSGSLAPGQVFSANFAIQNLGSAPARAGRVSFYLSEDPQITAGDRWLGASDYGALAAGSSTELRTVALSLPTTTSNFFWDASRTYYVGMVIEASSPDEVNLLNNANSGNSIDYTSVTINDIPDERPFKIQFDYRFDTNQWFTPARRAILESAARIWETIIQDDFPAVPAGEGFSVFNPQPVFSTFDTYTFTTENLALGEPIDDLVIFVSAGNIGMGALGGILGLGSPAVPRPGSSLTDRYTGDPFQPWAGSIFFNTAIDWFFDPTPNSADDLLTRQSDFLSTALHEIGHLLGFIGSVNAFSRLTVNQAFTGRNAISLNGGNPIPLSEDGSHIQFSPIWNPVGKVLMETQQPRGGRQLPTRLDLAILDDLGYSINYSAASQNKS